MDCGDFYLRSYFLDFLSYFLDLLSYFFDFSRVIIVYMILFKKLKTGNQIDGSPSYAYHRIKPFFISIPH